MPDTFIKFACYPEDWSKSMIRVVGVPGYDTQQVIAACDLPADLQGNFGAMLTHFLELGKGNWIADFIVIERQVATQRTYIQPDGQAVTVSIKDAVKCNLTVTACNRIQQFCRMFEDAESIALYDTLVSPEFWAPIVVKTPKSNTK